LKLVVRDIQENPDGSVVMIIDMDEDTRDALVHEGLRSVLLKFISSEEE